MTMWNVLYCFLSCNFLLHERVWASNQIEGITNDVTISCINCEPNYGGVVGRNITLRYEFKYEFAKLVIKYNETYGYPDETGIINVLPTSRYIVKPSNFGKDRVFTHRTWKPGNSKYKNLKTFTLTLRELTEDDDGCAFSYIYEKDVDNPELGGAERKFFKLPPTRLRVRKPEDRLPSTGDEEGDSMLIIIIVVVSIVVLIACLLGVLLKSGVLHQGDHHSKDTRKYQHPVHEPGEVYPLGHGIQSYPEEKIYATPDARPDHVGSGEQLTEHAEVGPGGGRLGERCEKPAPSVYAQVKTESGNYPDLQHSRRSDRL